MDVGFLKLKINLYSAVRKMYKCLLMISEFVFFEHAVLLNEAKMFAWLGKNYPGIRSPIRANRSSL